METEEIDPTEILLQGVVIKDARDRKFDVVTAPRQTGDQLLAQSGQRKGPSNKAVTDEQLRQAAGAEKKDKSGCNLF